MGVACLKIEGRMKRPEYVAAVTEIYARLLREHRTPTKDEQKKLALAFSRDGFTEGYYRGVRGREMFGTRPENARWPEDWFSEIRARYEKENTAVECDGDQFLTQLLGPVEGDGQKRLGGLRRPPRDRHRRNS